MMTFSEARTALRIGQQVRFTEPYGAFPFSVPSDTTGTVIDVRLDDVDPVIVVECDDRDLLPDQNGLIHVRGPEEALPTGINSLTAEEIASVTLGHWGDPMPIETVTPPSTDVEHRRAAVTRQAERWAEAMRFDAMSDDFYYTNGRHAAAKAILSRLEALADAITE